MEHQSSNIVVEDVQAQPAAVQRQHQQRCRITVKIEYSPTMQIIYVLKTEIARKQDPTRLYYELHIIGRQSKCRSSDKCF